MQIVIPKWEKPRRSKMGNTITEVDGIKFDSGLEANRYAELLLMQKAGEIRELTLQKPFEMKVNGIKVCSYIADFYYLDVKKNLWVVEDSKGFRTPMYKLKKKLMLAVHGITVREV